MVLPGCCKPMRTNTKHKQGFAECNQRAPYGWRAAHKFLPEVNSAADHDPPAKTP